MAPKLSEVNFDGLVGPTHNYAGLSPGNLASNTSRNSTASPKQAALEGIQKMRFVHSLGTVQGFLPPHPRPLLRFLHTLGFGGSDEKVLADVARTAPHLLAIASSSSAMWTANAANVAPSCDTTDGRVHFVPANLTAMPHRCLEAATTTTNLKAIFRDAEHFVIHDPLPGSPLFSDEGAANHTRLYSQDGAFHLFAYGRKGHKRRSGGVHPARQSLEASQAVARLLHLKPNLSFFAEQNPMGIDAGAFHTDVLAVGSGHLVLAHELAFQSSSAILDAAQKAIGKVQWQTASNLNFPVDDAVHGYAFNSQLIETARGFEVVAPKRAEQNASSKAYFERLQQDGVIEKVHYLDVNQSMKNGGGPACLRLRVSLNKTELGAVAPGSILSTGAQFDALEAWVERHYRDALTPKHLHDPALWRECMTALDDLTTLTGLGSLYEFQRTA